MELPPSEIAVTTLLLVQSSFFASGRNNSFASFDMMNGYNGITHTDDDFHMLAVSLQTVLSNWLGPVWWSLAGLRMLLAWLEVQEQHHTTPKASFSTISLLNNVASNGTPDSTGTKTPIKAKAAEPNANGHHFQNREPDSTIEKAPAPQAGRPYFEHLIFQSLFTASSSLAVMLACIWMRNDPALWKILAPKYVNVALWATFHHIIINGILCTGLWCLIVG